MEPIKSAQIIAALESIDAAIIATEITSAKLAQILSNMPPERAGLILDLLSTEQVTELVSLIEQSNLIAILPEMSPDKLFEIAPPLVGSRFGFARKDFSHLPLDLAKKLKKGVYQLPAMDINSTVIRERLKKGLYCGHLLPRKVLDYIYQNRLYSS